MPLFRLFRVATSLLVLAAVVVLLLLGLTLGGIVRRHAVGRDSVESTAAPREDLAVMGTTSVPPTNADATTATAASQEFLLKEVDGVLVVFSENAPVRRLELDPRLLPTATRAALAEGISADTWQDMLRLIADLGE